MKILVTGSHGFIGKSLVKRLKENDHDVIEVDKKNGIDLTSFEVVENLPDVDAIFHLAAYNGTKWFYEKPFDVVLDNTLPTINLLKRYASNLNLFVFAGTCESYAGIHNLSDKFLPTDENVPLVISDVTNPRWSYGGSKIGNEVSVIAAHEQHGMNFQILRFHNVYGPDQIDHFFPEFIDRVKKGDFSLKGYSNTRSFLYIDDCIDYVLELFGNPNSFNQVINIGSEDEISIEKAAKMVLNLLNLKTELELKKAPIGSVSRRLPDLKKLKLFTKKRNLISLEEGIKKLLL
tara:strand:+ start:227 stop:1096 length:870 start_codon:yes stop_codon:yes gene_type:complete